MHVLLLHAFAPTHPTGEALRATAQQQLATQGHSLNFTDLYADVGKFPGRADFTTEADAARFDYAREQRHAAAHNGFAADIRAEQAKLMRADALLLHFPLTWQGLPAVLHAWAERVLAAGWAHGPGVGAYRTGGLAGKRALCVLSTDEPEMAYGVGARHGDLHALLYPVQRGLLAFVGLDVLPPFVVWGAPHLTAAEHAQYQATYAHRLRLLARTPPLRF